MYYNYKDVCMMGVRLVRQVWSEVLYHRSRGFLVTHVRMIQQVLISLVLYLHMVVDGVLWSSE